MLPTSLNGRRRCIAILILALVSMPLLTACRTTPTPVATAVVTAPATVTGHPIVARRALATVEPTRNKLGTPEPLIAVTGTANLPPFTIPLPTDWQHVMLNRRSSEAQLQMIAAANAELLPVVQRFLEGRDDDRALLVAWPSGQQDGSGLVAYLIPRRDLSLQRYLTAAAHALGTTTVVTLHEAVVQYRVHPDVPVGYLHYTLADQGAGSKDGHHYLLFDATATQLLLLTFVTSSTTGGATGAAPPAAASGMSAAALSATATPPPFAQIVQEIGREAASAP